MIVVIDYFLIQRIEQSVCGYRDEVAALRGELNRKQLEAEKAAEDRSEIDKKSADLNGTIFQLQSQLRESESNYTRVEKESQRLAGELEHIKSSLQEKEADLRANMAYAHEIQKHSNEEKISLRTELRLKFILNTSNRKYYSNLFI